MEHVVANLAAEGIVHALAAQLVQLLGPLALLPGLPHVVGDVLVGEDVGVTPHELFRDAAGDVLDVPDPYYAGSEMFDDVLAMIESASRALFRQLEPAIRPTI